MRTYNSKMNKAHSDILKNIAYFLGVRDLTSFACVCKLFKSSISLGVEHLLSEMMLNPFRTALPQVLSKIVKALKRSERIALEESDHSFSLSSKQIALIDTISGWAKSLNSGELLSSNWSSATFSEVVELYKESPGRMEILSLRSSNSKNNGEYAICTKYQNPGEIMKIREEEFNDTVYFDLNESNARTLLFYCFFYQVRVKSVLSPTSNLVSLSELLYKKSGGHMMIRSIEEE